MARSIESLCGKKLSMRNFLNNDFVGVEIEMENLSPLYFSELPAVRVVNDGSLRGASSCEVVTEVLPASKVEYVLYQVKNTIDICKRELSLKDEDVFSHRTSVHVHLNMSDTTVNDVEKLIVLYMAVEPHLFTTLFPSREQSNFCVPYYTMLPQNPLRSVGSKYWAVNKRTLSTYGTLEFRQMHGNCDVGLIMKWINIILALKDASLRFSWTEIESYISNESVFSVLGLGDASASDKTLGKYSALSSINLNRI